MSEKDMERPEELQEQFPVEETPQEMIPEEAPAEEIFEQESYEEVPAEEVYEAVPAEEVFAQIPAEEIVAEDAVEAAPAEDAPAYRRRHRDLSTPSDAAFAEDARAASVASSVAYIDEEAPAPKKAKKEKKEKKAKKPLSKTAKIVLIVIAAVLVLGGVFLGIYINRIVNRVDVVFNTGDHAADKPGVENLGDVTLDPSDPDYYEEMLAKADLSMLSKDIVNVMVIGVDYAPERDTWNGKKSWHADVMLVLAINTKENTVDMISLPRDTYAKIPGVKGIYKLNASLDCGGGVPDGFGKVMEAGSWMLGDIPIDYYFAVTMPAVKELVNAMGGVTYDLEEDFEMAGREYKAGEQFMDGQAVLDYLRVRKDIGSKGDLNRVNRQKRMLMALFDAMKSRDMLLKVPDILGAVQEGTYTNLSNEQILSLACFAYKLDTENIGMYSMGGHMESIFNWNFCITDQKNRVNIIKEVYGVDAKAYSSYTKDGAHIRWNEMRREPYLKTAGKLLKTIGPKLDADALLPEKLPVATPAPVDPGTEGGEGAEPTQKPVAEKPVPGVNVRQYSPEIHALYTQVLESIAIIEAEEDPEKLEKLGVLDTLVEQCDQLASLMKQPKIDWKVPYEKDPSFNEIYVDFR